MDSTATEQDPLPSPSLWQHQRPFLIKSGVLILLPMVLLMVYWCYDKGLAIETGRVTITHTLSHLKGGETTHSGIRGGGTMTTPIRMDYSVWGKTKDGRICFLDVNSEKEFSRYQEGDVLETRFTTHKKRGEWAWTSSAETLLRLFLATSIVIFILAQIRLQRSLGQ